MYICVLTVMICEQIVHSQPTAGLKRIVASRQQRLKIGTALSAVVVCPYSSISLSCTMSSATNVFRWSIFDDQPFKPPHQVAALLAYLDEHCDYTELARLTFVSGFLVDSFRINSSVSFEQFKLLSKACLFATD